MKFYKECPFSVVNKTQKPVCGNKHYYLSFGPISARTLGEIRGLGGCDKIWPHKTRVVNGILKAEYLKSITSGRYGAFFNGRK